MTDKKITGLNMHGFRMPHEGIVDINFAREEPKSTEKVAITVITNPIKHPEERTKLAKVYFPSTVLDKVKELSAINAKVKKPVTQNRWERFKETRLGKWLYRWTYRSELYPKFMNLLEMFPNEWEMHDNNILMFKIGHVQAGDYVEWTIGLQSWTLMQRPGHKLEGLNPWRRFCMKQAIKRWKKRKVRNSAY